MRALLCGSLLLLISVGGLSAANAAPASTDALRVRLARQHYKLGRLHYNRQEFRKAIVQFRKAQSYRQHAFLHFVLGQCYRNLKAYSKALFAYKLYLDERPRAANRREVLRFIRTLQKKIALLAKKRRSGRLSVVTQPRGAKIYINTFRGKPRGKSPTILTVPAGQHVIEVRLRGYERAYRKAVVKAGGLTLVQVNLVAVRRRPVSPGVRPRPRPGDEWSPGPLSDPVVRPKTRVTTPPSAPPPEPTPTPAASQPLPPHHPDAAAPAPAVPQDSSYRPQKVFWSSWWFWTGLSISTIGFTAGVLLRKDYNKEKDKSDPSSSALKDYKNSSTAGYAVGGTLVGAVVIGAVINGWLYYRKPKRRTAGRPAFSCGIGACTMTLQF